MPESGLVLLDLKSGASTASLSVGTDAVAVSLSVDGTVAFVADSAPGDVYAVKLETRRVLWRAHTGGNPFGLLPINDRLYVSLFSSGLVDELAMTNGQVLATHTVGEGPAVMAIDSDGEPVVALRSGHIATLDGSQRTAGAGYGIVTVGGDEWTADYKLGALVRTTDGRTIDLPAGQSPFWLGAGSAGTILVSCEGADEDRDAGAVLRVDPQSGSVATLAKPRDPDQVEESGGVVYVAAHGDRDVLAIAGGTTTTWARGVPAVALAPDPKMNLLVVAVNGHE